MSDEKPDGAEKIRNGLNWPARDCGPLLRESDSDSNSFGSSYGSNPLARSGSDSAKGSFSPLLQGRGDQNTRKETFSKLKESFNKKHSLKRTATLQMRSSISAMQVIDPEEIETYSSLFKKLQNELRNNTQNVITFERAIDEGQDRPKAALKRNMSEKKLQRMVSMKVVGTAPFDYEQPELKPKDSAVDVSSDDVQSSKSRVTSVGQANAQPFTPSEFPMQRLVPQQSIILDECPNFILPQTPQMKRRRVTGLPPELHSGKREDLKRSALLDLENFKHEAKNFVPNPNKNKVFDFKREEKEAPELDERTLINLNESDIKSLLVDRNGTPMNGNTMTGSSFERSMNNISQESTFTNVAQLMTDKSSRFGTMLEFKQRLSQLRKPKPPKHTELLIVGKADSRFTYLTTKTWRRCICLWT